MRTKGIQGLRGRILALSRIQKQVAMFVSDSVGIALSVLTAIWLATGTLNIFELNTITLTIATVAVAIPLAWHLGLYRSIIRYIGVELFVAGSKTVLSVSLFAGVIAFVGDLVVSPGRWVIAFCALSGIYVVGGRFFARVFLNLRRRDTEPVIIYGAGTGGARLIAALKSGDEFEPIALVDDNILVRGKQIAGVTVFSPSNIEKLIVESGAKRVLLAMPSASRHRRRVVLERLSNFPVYVQTVPEISDLVTGKARVDDIRDVDVADLLGRDAVPPDMKLLRASIDGKTVMVTGAGGSIGSELCRQILKLGPKGLVLFERSEIALYTIEKELRNTAIATGIECEIVSLLGSVHDQNRTREALLTYNVCTVYHAAAYKHVPLVERNLLEGVHNNIFGTLHVAKAALEANVDSFVLISTDKAVSPTSVMGATKRFAELILQSLQDISPSTRFSMVRFGNVLASSGSVVPLFREQIRKGGPVTVTHREIIRYFMTIPEAAQLVIQSGAMAKGGDVFVLDMGQPVKISDLARRMINLMGLTVRDEENPDGDIAIQYTGLRPAEKLFEELLIGNDVSGTSHPRIMRATEEYIPQDQLQVLLEELDSAVVSLDRDRARDILRRAVAGYSPSNGIEDLVWLKQNSKSTERYSENIVDITTKRA